MPRLTMIAVVCVFLADPALAAEPEPPFVNIGLCSGSSLHGGSVSPVDPKTMLVQSDMSNAFYSHDGGQTWHLIHMKYLQGHGSTCPAEYDPANADVIYWTDSTAVKVTKDRGITWALLGESQPWGERNRVRRIYLDPDFTQRLFVGTDSGLYMTENGGKDWKQLPTVSGRVFRIAADRASAKDKRVYFVGTADGVFRSDDGGATFQKKSAGLPDGGLTGFAGASNKDETILYACTPCTAAGDKLAGGMYRSTDKGEKWERCMNADIDVDPKLAKAGQAAYQFVTASDKMPKRAYVYCAGVSYYPPNHSTIYRTDDAGASWKAVYFSDPRFKAPGMECNVPMDWQTEGLGGNRWQGAVRALEINAADPDMCVVTQERWYIFTANAGKSWQLGHTGTRVEKDGQVSWRNNGLMETSCWDYLIDPFEKSRRYIAQTDIGFSRSIDGGATWIWGGPALPKGVENTTYQIAFDPEIKGKLFGAFANTHDIPNYNTVYGSHFRPGRSDGAVGVSLDFGATWTKLWSTKLPVTSVVLDPKSPKGNRTLYAAQFEGGVWRSSDDGKTWEQCKNVGLGSQKNQRSLKIILQPDGSLLNLVTGKVKGETDGVGIYRSTDKGDNWTKLSEGQPWTWLKDFSVNPRDPNEILVGASRDKPGLYRTKNLGKTWELLGTKGKEHFGGYFHPAHPGWIYMTLTEGAEESGLYLSQDDGKTWKPYSQIPFANIQRVCFDPDDADHIYLTTFGYSVIEAPAQP
ncbi:MAG: WD40/YVTN/BNR-like repeat-containing protein [Phycisphaerae bacterium]